MPRACAPGWPAMARPRLPDCEMPARHLPDDRSVDWTGVRPDDSPIEPLNSRTFVERLQRLSARARDLTLLRKALAEQRAHEERLSRNPERTP